MERVERLGCKAKASGFDREGKEASGLQPQYQLPRRSQKGLQVVRGEPG